MQIGSRPIAGRFRLEALFQPGTIAAIGAAAAPMVERLRAGGFAGTVLAAADVAAIAALPAAPDLAVLCDANPDPAALFPALAARGCHAALVLGMAPGLRAAAEASGVRALGPGSFGLAIPALGLDATTGHLPARPGRLALVSQSAALCRAVLDWAEPNGVGFSHIIGIGGNADIGFALALDWLARDSGTEAILLDIRRIKSARLFLSAARAAAHGRPVVAIRAGGRLIDPEGDADAAFEAALRRAGVLAVATLEELLAAAETLSRAPPLRRDAPATLAIVTNAIGPALLAADAALREGVALTALAPTTRAALSEALPGAFARREAGGAEVPAGVGDIVYCGVGNPARLAEAAELLEAAPEVGGVLVVHAPTGPADAAGIAALAAPSRRKPLVCAMGETTGAAHRRLLAEAGLAVFATPEQAVRGFAHLVRHRRSREAARELPPRAVMRVEPDRAAADALLTGDALDAAQAEAVLAAYRITEIPGPKLLLGVADDAMLGPTIAIGRDAPGSAHDLALDLPPLNLALARAQFARTRIAGAFSPERQLAVAEALVRVSQLVVDFPRIATLAITLHPLAARITLRPPWVVPPPLAIPPYPAELERCHQAAGEAFILRPIRPEDADAHGEFFARLPSEDVRYRFFTALRELSAERMARLTQMDYEREIAFIAIRAGSGDTVGVARLVRESSAVAGQGDSGEFAIAVQPDAKGRGLGSALMDCLIGWARAQGMTTMTGQVLADNAPMLAFVRHLGFTIRRLPRESDVLEAVLDL